MDQRSLTSSQFGATAERYLTSTVHAAGADLERLFTLGRTRAVGSALDLGCGAGHAAYALARAGVGRIVAYDLSAPMLAVVGREAAARGHAQIETCAGPAEQLPFADASVELVVTRFSAHHWLDVPVALAEAARTLKPGGILVVVDVLAPERALMDTALQSIEILRDASHVRDYRESEWRSMMAAHFTPPEVQRWKLPTEFDGWVARIGTSPARLAALKTLLDELPTEARDYFAVAKDRSFSVDAGWFEAAKR